MSEPRLNRRTFLKVLGAGATAAAGLRTLRRASASEATGDSPHRWAMVIDQSKCTGCGYCTLACRAHNDVAPGMEWNTVLESGQVAGEQVYLPRPCMHCEQAPCVDVCPVKASVHRADGIVMMDYDRCIGCRYCEVACPYAARSFNWEAFTGRNPAVPRWGEPEVARRPRGVVEKCTFCVHRIDRGLSLGLTPGVDPNATPACVVACPTGARTFGDLADSESNVSKLLAGHSWFRLREDLGTAPRVYYLPPRAEVTP
ncbi:MAG TPA: 4Fe-4S dicluster domain-containing protein [Anaerolineales bacterium]|nr:4Fe-4S dicluster domain-containing protein [Anaerolineales bacterium]